MSKTRESREQDPGKREIERKKQNDNIKERKSKKSHVHTLLVYIKMERELESLLRRHDQKLLVPVKR